MIIGKKQINEQSPTYIIAETGLNHNGDLKTALKMCSMAKVCGVDAIKFQKRELNKIYSKEILDNPNKCGINFLVYIDALKKCELHHGDHIKLKAFCDEIGIEYLCTPFDTQSADFLDRLVNAYKVSSASITDKELIRNIVAKKKPMLISTGMSTMDNINEIVEFLNRKKSIYALLHCVSSYPVDFKDCNLKMIPVLKKEFDCLVGYSGHERGVEVSVAAVCLGAKIIERHFTLDRTMQGIEHASSLEPIGLQKLVEHIRAIELAIGDGVKKITRGELLTKEVLRKNGKEVDHKQHPEQI